MASGGTTQPAEAQICKFGYRCIFEGDSTDYQCLSCKQLLRDAHVTTCCQQHYCKGFLEDKQNCPGCHEELHFAQNKFLNKTLQKQQVICMEREYGCQWKGSVKDLDEHQSHCEYVPVLCENCQESVSKISINVHHQEECPEREYSCPYCSEKSTYRFVTGTHIPLCQSAPVVCPNGCGVAAERDIIDNHIQNECPLREMMCPFSGIGCDSKFRRDESEEHMKKKVPTHLTALANYTLQLNTKVDVTKTLIEEELQKRDDDRARNERRDKKLKEMEEEIEFLKKKVEFLSLAVNNPPENEISPPESQGEAEKIDTATFERKLEEKDAKINQLSESIKAYRVRQAKMEKRLLNLENSLKAMQPSQAASSQEQAAFSQEQAAFSQEQAAFSQEQAAFSQEQPAMLTIKGFTEKKLNKESWKALIFKNKPEMPQLVLTVWPNGQQEGKNTHVSVWLEHEDTQFQPAHIIVYFDLLNQLTDMNHISTMCMFSIEEGRYIGAISNTLIEHSALDYNSTVGTQYLVNDCLKFRVFIQFIEPPCWAC